MSFSWCLKRYPSTETIFISVSKRENKDAFILYDHAVLKVSVTPAPAIPLTSHAPGHLITDLLQVH